jgi:hypothetical protein
LSRKIRKYLQNKPKSQIFCSNRKDYVAGNITLRLLSWASNFPTRFCPFRAQQLKAVGLFLKRNYPKLFSTRSILELKKGSNKVKTKERKNEN